MDNNVKPDSTKEPVSWNLKEENMALIPPANEEISLGNIPENDNKPKPDNNVPKLK